MSLIIPPGYLQAVYVLNLVGDAEPMVTTCGHEIDGASGANAEDAANDLFTAFATNIVSQISTVNYSLVEVVAYIGSDGPTIVSPSTEEPVFGVSTANTVPQNTAYLFRKRTDAGGRRGRGRMYMPGVPENNVDNAGNVSGANITFVQGQLDAWYASLTSAVGARLYPPVVLHRSEGIGAEPPPTPITQFTVAGKVATQRRRLRP